MAHADIRIELEGGTDENGYRRYEPGAQVWGTVHVRARGETRCNHLYVRLQWHTEGRGERDTGKVAEADVFQGTLADGSTRTFDFRFTLPHTPVSYAGFYVTIVWEVAVELDVPWSGNPQHTRPFVLAPGGPAQVAVSTADRFDLVLVHPGANVIALARALQELDPTRDPKQLGTLVVSLPATLLSSVPHDRADAAKTRLESLGATVEVRPTGHPTWSGPAGVTL